MDHHEQHHQHHEKERHHEKELRKQHEHEAERRPRSIHPGWFLGVGVLLVLLAVLVWTFVL